MATAFHGAARRAARGSRALLAVCVCSFFCTASALAAQLPSQLAPPAPFPLVTATAFEDEFVAPGISYAEYHLATSAGPLVAHVAAIDVRAPGVRLDTVLASDRLVSSGETTSSMALRAGAVVGINADYYDIGNTNQPLGIVIRDGSLLRTPSGRGVLTVTREREIRFETYRFTGSADFAGSTIAVTGVNLWPPQGGASLLTPAYGLLAPAPGVKLARLQPLDAPLAGEQRYRVTEVVDALARSAAGFALALGPAALSAAVPAGGDVVTVRLATDPPLDQAHAAAGGGPILIRDGRPYDDPDAPALDEHNRRFPVAGAARTVDGTLLLIEVDGRQPGRSIGLTRPEFGALMRALGGVDGMAFDSGGSATLVTRKLGERTVSVRNRPSDGVERPVADGLFAFSDVPVGAPARLVVRPAHPRLLPGSTVALSATVTDAAGHYLQAASGAWEARGEPGELAEVTPDGLLRAARVSGDGVMHVRRQTLRADIPITVVERVARLVLESENPNPDPHGLTRILARAFDQRGYEVATDGQVRWKASGGGIDERGFLRTGAADTLVTAEAGSQKALLTVRVGRHAVALPMAQERTSAPWTFATYPAGGPGSVALGEECADCLTLRYDFTGLARAAYANGNLLLGNEPLSLSFDVLGDGSGVGLRAAYVNGLGERFAATLAKTVDWTGWQRREIRFPRAPIAPLRLVSVYAVNALGTPAVAREGSISVRDPRLIVPGTPLSNANTSPSPKERR